MTLYKYVWKKLDSNRQIYSTSAVTVLLGFLTICTYSPALAVPVLQVELPASSFGASSSTKKISFIVVGQISGKRIWLNEKWIDLAPFDESAIENPSLAPAASPDSQINGQGISQTGSASAGLPAKFGIAVGPDGGCADDKRIRDLLYLIRSLGKSIGSVEISHSGAAEKCVGSLSRQLNSFGLSAQKTTHPEAAGATSPVMLRLFFIESESLSKLEPNKAPAAAQGPADSQSLRVFVDNRPIAVDLNGWFATSLRSGNAPEIEVRFGNQSVFRSSAEVFVLNPGVNSNYRSERYMAVELLSGAVTRVEIIEKSAEEIAGTRAEISVPVFVKVGLGYTLLTPLPTEKERDRTTVLLALRSYPLFDRYHLAAEVLTSIKSESRIPWTVLGTFLAGTDLVQFRGNWSLPIGVGVRLFQSSIKQRSSDAVTGKSIRIPEAVLGLAAQIGASYRSGLFYAELAGSLTPVFADGADPIITFNPMFATGYQISRIDIVSLSLMNQDIRYPSIEGEAKVVSSSMILAYQRDFL